MCSTTLLYSFLQTCVAPPSFVNSNTVPSCSIVFYSVRLARLVVLRPITISNQRRDCKTLLSAELTPFSDANGTHAANKRNVSLRFVSCIALLALLQLQYPRACPKYSHSPSCRNTHPQVRSAINVRRRGSIGQDKEKREGMRAMAQVC